VLGFYRESQYWAGRKTRSSVAGNGKEETILLELGVGKSVELVKGKEIFD